MVTGGARLVPAGATAAAVAREVSGALFNAGSVISKSSSGASAFAACGTRGGVSSLGSGGAWCEAGAGGVGCWLNAAAVTAADTNNATAESRTVLMAAYPDCRRDEHLML